MKSLKLLLLAATAIACAAPAFAQKSADTIRLAINNTYSRLSQYHESGDEAATYYQRIWQSLIAYDEHNKKWVPQLAKSWTRVSPTVLEFDLQEGIIFHNGNKFDADDVVATFMYLADPKTVLRYKDRYNWVEKVEKLSPYKIRIVQKQPNAIDLGLIAYRYNIQDAETMATLQDQADYGRTTPYGTGYYKVVQIDKNKGIIVERFEEFKGDKTYARAPVKRIHGIFVPDRQTQIAQLLTGGLEMIRNVIPDQANELKKHPAITITSIGPGDMLYFALDASGQAGNKALTDVRVREAIFTAIDRDAIIKHIVPAGEVAVKMMVPCFESTVACKHTKRPPEFNPDRAKKLLAEAGYANGFDLVYDVYAPIKDIAIAISGDLRKVGIRTNVVPEPIEVYRKKQSDGTLQSWSQFFPLNSFPDASQILALWFADKRAEYFNSDPVMIKANIEGLKETDPEKRDAIYRNAFDHMIDQHYLLPVTSLPGVWAHSKDVQILKDPLSEGIRHIGDFAWK